MNNDKLIKWSLVFILVYSFFTILMPVIGIESSVRIIKPISGILWIVLFFRYIYKYATKNNYKNKAIFLVWYSIISAILTVSPTYMNINYMLTSDIFFLPYVAVIYCCIEYTNRNLLFIKKISIISALLFMFFIFILRDKLLQKEALSVITQFMDYGLSMDTVTKNFCYPAGFMLLLFPLLGAKQKIILVIAFSVAFSLALFLGRRNMILTILMYFIMATIIYLSNNKPQLKLQKFLLYISFFLVGYLLIDVGYSIVNGKNNIVFFDHLMSRFDSDTRSHVLIPYYSYMNQSPFYWLFGHGIGCIYYSGEEWRRVIETGYLQIIMKVGIISLFLYAVILIKNIFTSYKGNILCNACGAYLLISLLETLYAGVPTFNLSWVFIWISVSIVNSRYYRSLSNEQIRNFLCQ